jgi:hypothetical protein
MAPHPAELAFAGMSFVIPWMFLIVLTSMSEVWGPADKYRSLLLYPVTLAVLAAAGIADVPVVSPALAVLAMALAVRVLIRLVRASRAHAGAR